MARVEAGFYNEALQDAEMVYDYHVQLKIKETELLASSSNAFVASLHFNAC